MTSGRVVSGGRTSSTGGPASPGRGSAPAEEGGAGGPARGTARAKARGGPEREVARRWAACPQGIQSAGGSWARRARFARTARPRGGGGERGRLERARARSRSARLGGGSPARRRRGHTHEWQTWPPRGRSPGRWPRWQSAPHRGGRAQPLGLQAEEAVRPQGRHPKSWAYGRTERESPGPPRQLARLSQLRRGARATRAGGPGRPAPTPPTARSRRRLAQAVPPDRRDGPPSPRRAPSAHARPRGGCDGSSRREDNPLRMLCTGQAPMGEQAPASKPCQPRGTRAPAVAWPKPPPPKGHTPPGVLRAEGEAPQEDRLLRGRSRERVQALPVFRHGQHRGQSHERRLVPREERGEGGGRGTRRGPGPQAPTRPRTPCTT